MSWAVFTWFPKGGRRNTSSFVPQRTRYVRLECPAGNCSTVSGPSNSGRCSFRYAASGSISSSSPARTRDDGLRPVVLMKLDVTQRRGDFNHPDTLQQLMHQVTK